MNNEKPCGEIERGHTEEKWSPAPRPLITSTKVPDILVSPTGCANPDGLPDTCSCMSGLLHTHGAEKPPSSAQPIHRKGNLVCLFFGLFWATQYWCDLSHGKRTLNITHYLNQRMDWNWSFTICSLKCGTPSNIKHRIIQAYFPKGRLFDWIMLVFSLNVTCSVSHIPNLGCSNSSWLRDYQPGAIPIVGLFFLS